jgi:GTP 3',8-cyclase
MPLDGSGIWQPSLVFSKKEMIKIITDKMMEILPSKDFHNNTDNTDPAMLYSFVDGKGTLGFIPSITEPFCGICDRIRLTSDGRLLTCLFENPGYDLANMLRRGKSDHYIKEHIIASVKKKPEGIIKIIRTKMLKPSLNLMHSITINSVLTEWMRSEEKLGVCISTGTGVKEFISQLKKRLRL